MAKYRITDPQTGKSVTVSGDRPPTQADAERIFQEAGLRGQAQQPQTNLAQKAFEFFLPQTNRTLTEKLPQGFEGEVFDRSQMAPNARGNVGASAQNALMETANLFGAGARPGLEVGSYMTPAGAGSLAGRMGLGGLSGLMFGLAQEDATPGDVLTTTGAGAVIPGGAALGSKGFNAVKDKVGQELVDQGKDLILRSLKPSPSQLTGFKQKTGQDLADFLRDQRITGNFVEEIGQRVSVLQEEFNDLALREGVNVPFSKVRQFFDGPISQLKKSVIPSVKAKADDLEMLVKNIGDQYGDEIPLVELTGMRRQFDDLLPQGQFGLPPAEAKYLKTARDTVKKILQETTDEFGQKGRLKDLGRELQKFYQLGEIAEKQVNKGRGTNLIQLRDAIFFAGGLAGGLPGVIGGIAANRLSQNPGVISGASGLLEGAGSKLQQMGDAQIPDLLNNLLRGAGQSASIPKRKPNNEKDDRFETMRRAQQATQEAQMQRPRLLP